MNKSRNLSPSDGWPTNVYNMWCVRIFYAWFSQGRTRTRRGFAPISISLIRNVSNKHGPREEKNKSYIQEITRTIPQMSQIVRCVIADL